MQSAPSVTCQSRSPKGTLRQLVEDARCVGRVARGAFRYSRTGTTPSDAYHSLIHLYCRTNGRSNDLLHALARRRFPPMVLPPARGVLGSLSSADVDRVAADIRENGYIRPAQRLPADVCQRLSEFSLRTEAVIAPPRKEGPARAVYDPARPIAEGYRFDEASLIEQSDIQRLMADPSLLAVAQAYLGCLPVLSSVFMLWSTPARVADNAREELAQMYHFDMDRLKWLKFFFYLTEVTPERGPHCFIAKSHRTGGQLPALLARIRALSGSGVGAVLPGGRSHRANGAARNVVRGRYAGLPQRDHAADGRSADVATGVLRLAVRSAVCASDFSSQLCPPTAGAATRLSPRLLALSIESDQGRFSASIAATIPFQ